MLRQRVMVAALLLPVGLAALYIGGWPLWLLGMALLLQATREYLGLWRHQGLRPGWVPTLFGVALLASVLYFLGPGMWAWMALVLDYLVLMAWHVVAYERGEPRAASAFVADAAGVTYLAGFGGLLLALRRLPWGWFWMLLALLPVWAADSIAYFTGRSLGRHRMAPRVSPKKTWEGYLGGVLGGIVAAGLWWWLAAQRGWSPPGFSLSHAVLAGWALALLTPLGDLGQSLLKRQAGLKDAGRLLPGHGGVFDRMDSWLWAGVLVYGWAWFWLQRGG